MKVNSQMLRKAVNMDVRISFTNNSAKNLVKTPFLLNKFRKNKCFFSVLLPKINAQWKTN